eukprot:15460439-Alexandrium_andersonii.AAC.1
MPLVQAKARRGFPVIPFSVVATTSHDALAELVAGSNLHGVGRRAAGLRAVPPTLGIACCVSALR